MTRHLPKASPDRGNQYTGGKTTVLSDSQKSKTVTVRELDFTPKQVERFETLAVNKDLAKMARDGVIPGAKQGQSWFFLRDDLVSYLDKLMGRSDHRLTDAQGSA